MLQRRAQDSEWARRFAARGWAGARPLGGGMDGAVYALDEHLVAKVWRRRGRVELLEIQAFYEWLAGAGVGFATPRIVEVWEEEGAAVTVEERLPGVPLDQVRPPDGPLDPAAVECMLDVLAGLRGAGAPPGSAPWPRALGEMVERALAGSGELLRAQVPGFEAMVGRLHELIAGLEVEEPAALHTDLIPANVLVDDSLRPLAVLDFGLLAQAGDPLFDLAVTASVYEMYGPGAAAVEAAIKEAAARRWDLPPDRLALYRAVYAIATATLYDLAGKDGHFRWCTKILNRPEVKTLLTTP
jgi:aminoglycoside phosphotransferase (APT) family kinase protein